MSTLTARPPIVCPPWCVDDHSDCDERSFALGDAIGHRGAEATILPAEGDDGDPVTVQRTRTVASDGEVADGVYLNDCLLTWGQVAELQATLARLKLRSQV